MIPKNLCSLSQSNYEIVKTKVTKKIKNISKTKKIKAKKYIYDPSKPQVIPLHIYQVWHNIDEIPIAVKESIQLLKQQNPEFEHHLYDEPKCRKYIQDNFPQNVLNAYDKVIPQALKADLWRYCIIYKEGGIYLDSKYYGINGFKFIHLIDKEYFCKDILKSFDGIYNAILICKPKNPIIKKTLEKFIENTNNNYYGVQPLCIGPLMMKQFFTPREIDSFELKLEVVNSLYKYVSFNGYRILKYHEKYKHKKNNHWSDYWKGKKLYN